MQRTYGLRGLFTILGGSGVKVGSGASRVWQFNALSSLLNSSKFHHIASVNLTLI